MALDPRISLAVDTSQIYDPLKAQQDSTTLAMNQARLGQVPLENQVTQQKLQSGDLDMQMKKVEAIGQLASGVTDENSWRQALNTAKSWGIDVSRYDNVPYDQKTVEGIKQQALSVKDRLMYSTGRGEGVMAANKIMQENPGMSFTDAYMLATAKQGQGITYNAGTGQLAPIANAPQAAGAMAYGKRSGTEKAQIEGAAPKAQQTELGKQAAENQQSAVSTQDMVGMYNKLLEDAKTTPSGALESGIASLANKANIPTKGSVAQATFDADLNNLYLGTIRSLKGTGRVMEVELNKIADAAPKPDDSNAVKIAKAKAHMAYYTQRMRELGFDPDTGQSSNPGSSTPQLPLPGNSNAANSNAPSGQYVEGQTYRNKKTGAVAIYKNGQFMPMGGQNGQ